MRTIEQAVSEETRRYVDACMAAQKAMLDDTSGAPVAPASVRNALHKAHIHALTLRRLRHHVVTAHEAACAATPSVHAYSDLDGYGR